MNKYSKRRTVGVVGFRGYAGVELLRLLARHPGVDVVLLEHRSDSDVRPQPIGSKTLRTAAASPEAIASEKLDLIFLCTPPEASIEMTPGLLGQGIKVIDLSGAFRLRDAGTYKRWYKQEHGAPDLFSQAVYGLPEFYRARVRGASLVSNPGCYPTAVNLALRPLVQAGVVDRSCGIVCDGKSGVSGAGRKPSLKTSFCEVTENFSAYAVIEHRHVPEVLQNSGVDEAEFTFTAQLIPIHRGILETVYLRTTGLQSEADVLSIYRSAYGNEPFVRLYSPGKLPDIRSVAMTNFCDIGFVFEPATRRLVIVTAIDNLTKGAAGQALQNMNLVLGYEETEALL